MTRVFEDNPPAIGRSPFVIPNHATDETAPATPGGRGWTADPTADAKPAAAAAVASPAPAAPVSLGQRFGIELRRQRERQGWTQEQLAERSGLNRSYLGEVERAIAMPSLATAAKLAQALGLPLAGLIGLCEEAAATA